MDDQLSLRAQRNSLKATALFFAWGFPILIGMIYYVGTALFGIEGIIATVAAFSFYAWRLASWIFQYVDKSMGFDDAE